VLHVFRSLPIALVACRADTLPVAAAACRRETITLGWEERQRGRARRRSDQGFEFGTTLPRGATLRSGDCFLFEAAGVVVEVVEAVERVLVIRPRSSAEWGVFGYHIGNSHFPLMIAEDAIICPDVPGMTQVLEYHAIPFVADERPFTPVSVMGDLVASGHDHRPALG
jgi:urease accessory protein UreE